MASIHPDMWLLPQGERRPGTPVIAAVGGDGIGPEIVEAALSCVEATGAPIEIVRPLHGQAAVEETGEALPAATVETLTSADAVLFGACDTSLDHSVKLLAFLRWGLRSFVNVRPSTYLPPVPGRIGDERCNLVICRELTEGLYPGREGDLADFRAAFPDFVDHFGYPLPSGEGKYAVKITTREGSERIARYAAKLAHHRAAKGYGPGRVTVVTKKNVMRLTDGLFEEICLAALREVDPDLEAEVLYVDEAARRLVVMPEVFDVMVMPNLFGDILSDIASEIMGGLPMCPSASIGDAVPTFESCHGSAPELAGLGLANPTATIFSAAMALAYVGHTDAAERLVSATVATIEDGVRTRDLGGRASTSEVAGAESERLR